MGSQQLTPNSKMAEIVSHYYIGAGLPARVCIWTSRTPVESVESHCEACMNTCFFC